MSSLTADSPPIIPARLEPLPASFYETDTVAVARRLLGARLVRRTSDGRVIVGRIVETEAYLSDDEAMHAYRGKTARNAPLFGPPGTSYVYFIYGVHYCFNVVTEAEGIASAVLIRGLDDLEGANGPGRICRTLDINLEHNGLDLTSPASPIWVARGPELVAPVVTTTRVGITRAVERPWRFYVLGSAGVSRRDRRAEREVQAARNERDVADDQK